MKSESYYREYSWDGKLWHERSLTPIHSKSVAKAVLSEWRRYNRDPDKIFRFKKVITKISYIE
jgi:hypothetical protein